MGVLSANQESKDETGSIRSSRFANKFHNSFLDNSGMGFCNPSGLSELVSDSRPVDKIP